MDTFYAQYDSRGEFVGLHTPVAGERPTEEGNSIRAVDYNEATILLRGLCERSRKECEEARSRLFDYQLRKLEERNGSSKDLAYRAEVAILL